MAIAEMSKLRLFGISYEKQRLLDALSRTGAVQIKSIDRESDTAEISTVETAEKAHAILSQKIAEYASAADFIADTVAEMERKDRSAERLRDYQFLTHQEFDEILFQEEELRLTASQVNQLRGEQSERESERNRLLNEIGQLKAFSGVRIPFSRIKDTKHAVLALGTISAEGFRGIKSFVESLELTCLETCGSTSQGGFVVFLASHRTESDRLLAKLSELGFVKCPFAFSVTVDERTRELTEKIQELDRADQELRKQVYAYKNRWSALKILIDRLSFELEKIDSSDQFRTTRTTFELEAYVPKECQEAVREAVDGVTEAAYYEFTEPQDTDNPPTLMKNNKVVRQFEFITNMYSVPNYRELDPNTIMSIFFMLFFGLIMADIGYGLILFGGCLFLAMRNRRDTGSRRLLYILAFGGVTTMIFGLLFGSFFGFTHEQASWIPASVMPDPQAESEKFLLYCLAAGVIQIMVGFILKGIQLIRQGDALGGLFEGFTWAVFFIGLLLAAVSLFGETIGVQAPQSLLWIGAGICGVTVLIEIFTAGRKSRGFGKFTKGFGAVYGIINYFSDILSYARLFGLMLSGAIIGNIVSEMSLDMIAGGGFGSIAGILVLLIGHAFNLAMGVLGAYIHDSRLQYIEFFSRFYEGEGELFRPLGSQYEYVQLVPEKN